MASLYKEGDIVLTHSYECARSLATIYGFEGMNFSHEMFCNAKGKIVDVCLPMYGRIFEYRIYFPELDRHFTIYEPEIAELISAVNNDKIKNRVSLEIIQL